MNNRKLRMMTYTSIFTALIFLVTYFLPPIKLPGGYFNFSDSVIILCALIVGGKSAAFAGAIGASLADMALGYVIFAPITFFVKGIEGLLVGFLAKSMTKRARVIAVFSGGIFMAVGYFLAEWFILPVVDDTFGYFVAISELPFNLIQGIGNAFIALALYSLLKKTNKNVFDIKIK